MARVLYVNFEDYFFMFMGKSLSLKKFGDYFWGVKKGYLLSFLMFIYSEKATKFREIFP